METIPLTILIVMFAVYLGIFLARTSPSILPKNFCSSDEDCEWKITNCCPENAGAKWECVNKKTFVPPECPGLIICPQVISPKPAKACVCKNGECVVR